MKKFKQKFNKSINLVPLFLLFMSSSCSSINSLVGSNGSALKIIHTDEILLKDKTCSNLVEGQINAWKSKDVEKLKKIYTNDIVHFDGYPAYVGIDEVIKMAEYMWRRFSLWEMKAGEVYISKNQCMGEWVNWNVMGFSQDDPGLEYDLLDFQNDKISFWRLFYDQKFCEAFNEPERIDDAFLSQFASTWSSGNITEIKNLYSSQAVYEDTLFDVSITGSRKISNYASSLFNQFPGIEWHKLYPFGEGKALGAYKDDYPFASQGALFEITLQDEDNKPCEIRAVIILTRNDKNKIVRQIILYDAESLVECGLAK